MDIIKVVASSTIRINEATLEDLQRIKGIGPKRAEYIQVYRNEVTPIRNTFDLAVATGLSLKSTIEMAPEIDWTCESNPSSASLWPAVFIAVITLGLIYFGFDQLTRAPLEPPASYFNIALALILMGAFAASGDIAISGVSRRPTETSWVFHLALVLLSTGLFVLIGLYLFHLLVGFTTPLAASVSATGTFILLGLFVLTLMYGPSLCLRVAVGDNYSSLLLLSEFIYGLLLLVLPIVAVTVLLYQDSSTWLEEIFAVWALAFLVVVAYEISQAKSPFLNMLSHLDQGRFRFINQRQRRVVIHSDNLRLTLVLGYSIGIIAICGTLLIR